MDDWANAVRTIVSHHRGLIDSYEIWNEPWGSSFWSLKIDPKHRQRGGPVRPQQHTLEGLLRNCKRWPIGPRTMYCPE